MVSVTSSVTMSDDLFLPWVESANDRRFKKILVIFVVSFIFVSVVVPFLPVPEIVQKDLKSVSPRISKLIREKQKEIPPPPPPPEPEVKKEVEKKPVEKEKKLDKKEAAIKKASNSGLVALTSELVDLRESFDFPLQDDIPIKRSRGAGDRDFKNEYLDENAAGSSAGIDVDSLSSTAGETQLSGRATTKVSSEIANDVAAAKKSSAARKQMSRSEREIEMVFQKNKGAIYSIYNRALRKDPTLEGKLVVELTISPDGRVTQCRVVSTELNSPALERKIVARVKLFKFKPAKVLETTVKYPIDFLPS